MIAPTTFRVWLSIALTVLDTQAVLAAIWLLHWEPTHPQLYALAGVAAVLLTMMGFDVIHSIAELKQSGLVALQQAASTPSTPPLSPAVPIAPTANEGD